MSAAAEQAADTSSAFLPLGALCEVIAGQSPKSAAYNHDEKGLPFYQGKKDFTDRYLAAPTTWTTQITKTAEPGDILMSVRAPVGPINEATAKICIGRGLAAIRPGTDIEKDFLWYALLWLQPKITGNAGAVFTSINRKSIEALLIPVPPLDEQKRIVAVLDQAFAALDRAHAHAETNLEDAEELFENSLTELFATLSKQVEPTPLAKAVHPDCKLSYGIVQPGSETPKGLPVVRPVDLKQRLIVANGLKRIAPERASGYARTKLRGGELLLCVRGSVGELAVASEELADANVTRGIVPIRFDEEELLPEFGYFQLRSRYARNQLLAKTYGAALTQINIKDLRCLSFLAPTLHIQQEIVRKIEHIYERSEQLKTSAAGKLRALEELRQSLLRSAFAGELV